MTDWLLDTNILSELRRRRPEPRVVAFVREQPLNRLYVSTVTIAEIRFGIAMVADSDHRVALSDWLEHTIRPLFESRVIEVTEDILLEWRLLVEEGRKSGHTYSQPDLMIASTAICHAMTVVSRDTSEYRRAGSMVFNPWTDEPPADEA